MPRETSHVHIKYVCVITGCIGTWCLSFRPDGHGASVAFDKILAVQILLVYDN